MLSKINTLQPTIAQSYAIRKIAVFRALQLGDMLCAIPALRALRSRFPSAEISLIGLPWAKELVQRLPYLDQLLEFPGYPGINEMPYDEERHRVFSVMAQAACYDLAIQLHGDGRVSNGFVAELGARVSLGYGLSDDRRLSFSLAHNPDEHEIRRWLRVVAACGAPQSDTRIMFPMFEHEIYQARLLLSGTNGARKGPLIGLHAGASDPARRWPAARFAALGDKLVSRLDARIVLTGTAAETEITGSIHSAMSAPACDLAGATNLGTFAALISQLDLLVTNDTGASHMAAALGTPSVVLFGPTRPARWAPLDQSRHKVIDALAMASPGTHPTIALEQLPLERVLQTCIKHLGSEQSLELGAS